MVADNIGYANIQVGDFPCPICGIWNCNMYHYGDTFVYPPLGTSPVPAFPKWPTTSPRRYLPTLSELIDRLSILQLKEVFIEDHKEEYAQEIQDVLHDINLLIEEGNVKLTADLIRAIAVVSQYNLHIWHNESEVRKGTGNGNLELTHSLNGIRNLAKNKIQETAGGRKDYKIDCLASDAAKWRPSGY